MREEELPHDWESPDWNNAGKVHDWKNYAGKDLRGAWPALPFAFKKLTAANLQAIANNEDWE
jgi:hypothetical protein